MNSNADVAVQLGEQVQRGWVVGLQHRPEPDSQATFACRTRCRSRDIACSSAVNADGRLSGRQWRCSWRSVSARTNASNASDFDADNRYRSRARAEIFGDTQNSGHRGQRLQELHQQPLGPLDRHQHLAARPGRVDRRAASSPAHRG